MIRINFKSHFPKGNEAISNFKFFGIILIALFCLLYSLPATHYPLLTGPVHAQDFPKQDILDVNLHYKDGQVALTSVDKHQGFVPDYLNQPQDGYTLTVFDKESAQLFSVKFNFPLQIHTDDFSDPANPKGEVQTLTEADTTVTIPVFENAQKLQVTEPDGSIVVSHDLSIIVDPNLAKRGATGGFSLDLKPWLIILGILGLLGLLVAAPTIIRRVRLGKPS